MTVQELMEKLSEFPGDVEVELSVDDDSSYPLTSVYALEGSELWELDREGSDASRVVFLDGQVK